MKKTGGGSRPIILSNAGDNLLGVQSGELFDTRALFSLLLRNNVGIGNAARNSFRLSDVIFMRAGFAVLVQRAYGNNSEAWF